MAVNASRGKRRARSQIFSRSTPTGGVTRRFEIVPLAPAASATAGI
jgi:hypothetical protein